MKESSRKWIEAAKILDANPSAIVPCPELGDGFLTVMDVPIATDPPKLERYLVCNRCGARNVILMNARKK